MWLMTEGGGILAIIKIYDLESKSPQEIRDYITDTGKCMVISGGVKRYLLDSVNCSIADLPSEFALVRKRYSAQEKGIHMIVMFLKGEADPLKVFDTGSEFLREICGRDFQGMVSTHVNKENLHCHLLINGVALSDGRTFREHHRRRDLQRLLNGICLDRGLATHTYGPRHRASYIVARKQRIGYPTKFNIIRTAFEAALRSSTSFTEFERRLVGYDVTIERDGKERRAYLFGEDILPRLETLGYEYTLEGIERRLRNNRMNRVPAAEHKSKAGSYSLPSREDYLLGKKGLLRDYALISLYIDSHPKRYDSDKFIEVRREIKPELKKLYSYSKRIRFIWRYGPENEEMLKGLIEDLGSERKRLGEMRKELGCGYFVRKGDPQFESFQQLTRKMRRLGADIETGKEILSTLDELRGKLDDIARSRKEMREKNTKQKGPQMHGTRDI